MKKVIISRILPNIKCPDFSILSVLSKHKTRREEILTRDLVSFLANFFLPLTFYTANGKNFQFYVLRVHFLHVSLLTVNLIETLGKDC